MGRQRSIQLVGAILIGACLVPSGVLVGSIAAALSGGLPDALKDFLTPPFSPSMFFFVGVLGPLVEELIFRRGLLHAWIATRPQQAALAIPVVAVGFAAIHLNLPQIITALFAGVIFGLLYWKTWQFSIPALAHCTYNVVLLALLMRDGIRGPLFAGRLVVFSWPVYAITAVLAALILFNFLRQKDPVRAMYPSSQNAVNSTAADQRSA